MPLCSLVQCTIAADDYLLHSLVLRIFFKIDCIHPHQIFLSELALPAEVLENKCVLQDVRCSHAPAPLGLYTDVSSAGTLPSPRPITVVDGLYYGDDETLRYHYVINEVLPLSLKAAPSPFTRDMSGW